MGRIADDRGNPLAGIVVSDGQQQATTDADGKVYVNSLPFGTYHFVEVKQAPGFVKPSGDSAKSASATISNKELSGKIEMSNTKLKGSLKVQKVDENGKNLPGAQFVLKRSDDSAVGVSGADGAYAYDASVRDEVKLSCDSNGALKVSDLPLGSYILEETDAPKGYTGKAVIGFELNDETTEKSLTVENNKYYASLKFTKVNGEDKKTPVSGAEFVIWDMDADEAFSTVTSNENGDVVCEFIPEGRYYVKETKAPEGYELNSNTYQFVVDRTKDNATTIVLQGDDGNGTIYDQRSKGSITIEKFDCTTSDYVPMEGVKFTIKGVKSYFNFIKLPADVAEIVTDEKGVARYDGLEWGDYTLVETAPYGYDAVTKSFTIGPNSTDVAFTRSSQDGPIKDYKLTTKIKVKKLDADDKKTELSGAKFNIYKMNGSAPDLTKNTKDTYVGQVVTDVLGEAEYTVEYGNYYFLEVEAPFGYELDDKTAYKVVADEKGKDAEVTVYDEKKLGHIIIKKVDDEGNPLEGAIFTLYNTEKPTDVSLGQ